MGSPAGPARGFLFDKYHEAVQNSSVSFGKDQYGEINSLLFELNILI